jgi:hypothetical protein
MAQHEVHLFPALLLISYSSRMRRVFGRLRPELGPRAAPVQDLAESEDYTPFEGRKLKGIG